MGGVDSKQAEKDHQNEMKDAKASRTTKVFEEMRKLQTKQKCILDVERTNILGTGLSFFKSSGCEYSPLAVIIKTSGVQEQMDDLGGPTREFFTLFYKEILKKDVDMFEGQNQGRNLLPVYNEKALANGWFTLLGKAIVASLLSGGPGFPYLAPFVVSYIRDKEYDKELNIGMVYNVILRQFIKRLNNAETEDQLMDTIQGDTERYIDHCGWPRFQMITLENRLHLTQILLKWELVGKRVAALEQLKKGLNTLSFLERTADIPEIDGFLLNKDTEKETAEYMKTSLKNATNKLQAKDETEENAKKFTLSCMEMLTDTEAISLFHFVTGMSVLPVEDIPIEVEFNRLNKKAEFPEAITCIQRLRIPLGNQSQMAFYSSFHKALSFGKYGFGRTDKF